MKTLIGIFALMVSLVFASTSQAQSVVTSSKRLSYDVDGDNVINSNDTTIIIRYLFGFSGSSLISGLTLSADSLRNTADSISAYLASLSASGAFDVDGNGRADALSDGLLIAKYYSGARRAKLISGSIDPAGLRNTDQAVIRFIRNWDF